MGKVAFGWDRESVAYATRALKGTRTAEFIKSIDRPYRQSVWHTLFTEALRNCRTVRGNFLHQDFVWCLPYRTGVFMDDAKQMLEAMNAEVRESQHVLEELYNKVNSTFDQVQPALEKQVTALRSSRMTLVSELRQSLNMLQEIRKFFLEADYDREMERLERFVRVCRDIKALKEDGTFDAVVDSAIRLALKEPDK